MCPGDLLFWEKPTFTFVVFSFQVPLNIFLNLTTPIIDIDCYNYKWNKFLIMLQCVVCPTTCSFVAESMLKLLDILLLLYLVKLYHIYSVFARIVAARSVVVNQWEAKSRIFYCDAAKSHSKLMGIHYRATEKILRPRGKRERRGPLREKQAENF